MITDQDILLQIRTGGDSKALAALYRHLPAIRRMIRYHGGSRQEAEDIFQEALIVFCRRATDDGFALSAGIYPYLYSVCRFLWNDEQKRRLRQQVKNISSHAEAEPEIAAAVTEESRYRLAEKIVAELGERCRELLLLFYSGVKLKEAAAQMGYNSEQTAKNQKYKCLEGARNKYRQEYTSHSTI